MVTPNLRLVRPLGEGGMGTVWLADHLALEMQVAVKFISADLPKLFLPALAKRFNREATAAARIKSPHVVTTRRRASPTPQNAELRATDVLARPPAPERS
ncbi:MAG: hypothetical protein HY744_30070 [Deltaproteobacteria bacterium]|nr:hypothetical protein [Deltaproteobacteria bacterium]